MIADVYISQEMFATGTLTSLKLSSEHDRKLACSAIVRPGFHYTTNATTTTQKQSDYKIEQSSFTLISLF